MSAIPTTDPGGWYVIPWPSVATSPQALEASTVTTPSNTSISIPAGQASTTGSTPEAPEATEDQVLTDAPEAEVEGDEEDSESTLDPKAKSALEKVRREAANLRKRLKEMEPAAKKLKEIEDRDKSETQKLTDHLAELQSKISGYEVREVRAAAAAAVGLPANMAQFITATDLADAKEQAKTLMGFAKAGPVDLKQGARQTAATPITGDQLIRRMAGRE